MTVKDYFADPCGASALSYWKTGSVRPRYNKPVTYIDNEFGHHYAVKKSGTIPLKDKEVLFARLNEWMNR